MKCRSDVFERYLFPGNFDFTNYLSNLLFDKWYSLLSNVDMTLFIINLYNSLKSVMKVYNVEHSCFDNIHSDYWLYHSNIVL